MNNLAKEIASTGAGLIFNDSGGYSDLNIRASDNGVIITVLGHEFHANREQAKAMAAYIHACSEAVE